MNRQDTIRAERNSGLMARWLASGGAIEAPAAIDAAADDGLRAGRMTTHPFACADQELRCGSITQGYGCIPPQADDGLTGGPATYAGCGM